MNNIIKEFVDAGGTLISSKIPNTNPLTTAKKTTDASVKMRAQPFLYTVYRRFFSENELPHTAKADEYQNDPEKFHNYLKTIGEGDNFEQYFQKTETAKEKLKEIAKNKAYNMLEILLANKNDRPEVFNKVQPTIEEIKNKEVLLLDKLTKVAEAIKSVMNEDEKKVIIKYFNSMIK